MTTDLQVVADYLAASTVVAFDFETAPRRDWQGDGTAALDPHRGEIVGISLAVAARADHQPGPSISPSATAILLGLGGLFGALGRRRKRTVAEQA